MKKFGVIAIALVLAVTGVLFAACSKEITDIPADSEYIGTWKATDFKILNESDTADDVLGKEMFLVLKADGTSELSMGENTSASTWTIIKNGIKIKGESDTKFKKDGDKLKTKIFGLTVTFEKVE